ncbi:MAG: biopolymer transporter ExbD [Bacteroidales bacterium]|jgi:biopolymer transport protein ExbD|nr:biopolymer transporter ExbD [Bacteroidales bacterium]MCB5245944.1 biopolymer transporter ExbD [Candidatus Cloacimonadota bacterium]MDI9576160.1 biopolymer transporter ExbD [Bacteroidota bacterium]MDY0401533.1 biopolymer transporter ExbD [Bacteroidales bacterium]HQD59504.1 biopolymer transporter ExbD [Bacteroidales bacterium]
MDLRPKHRIGIDMNSTSMSDLVFLLLIFFMLTSTLISPNAIKLLLPSSTSPRVLAPAKPVKIYIDQNLQYYIDGVPVDEIKLAEQMTIRLKESPPDAAVVINADATVPVQAVVNIIDIVNQINESLNATHKAILATQPKK